MYCSKFPDVGDAESKLSNSWWPKCFAYKLLHLILSASFPFTIDTKCLPVLAAVSNSGSDLDTLFTSACIHNFILT